MAGPLVAGAVLLAKPIRGLKDSKKLTRSERERLDVIIRRQALAIGIGWVDAAELDSVGLTQAVRLAMQRAVEQITLDYDEIIIDGNYNYLAQNPKSKCLIKADDLVPAVSAASIVAKVARDDYMRKIALQYPGYSFETHVGYCTKAHMAALDLLGSCAQHRVSFAPVRAILPD